jgi:hypothetical protein
MALQAFILHVVSLASAAAHMVKSCFSALPFGPKRWRRPALCASALAAKQVPGAPKRPQPHTEACGDAGWGRCARYEWRRFQLGTASAKGQTTLRVSQGGHAREPVTCHMEKPPPGERPAYAALRPFASFLPLSPPRDQHGNQDDGDGNQHPVLERHTQERDSLC